MSAAKTTSARKQDPRKASFHDISWTDDSEFNRFAMRAVMKDHLTPIHTFLTA